ncbi:MAG: hypothetical protein FWG87_03635 [Defluviitaleaceae bacterium]|nr:hypothetical protein [Defluviitaleaceae bacterium]
MLYIYDLYELHEIILFIRSFPEHKLNELILSKTLDVLNDTNSNYDKNRFRVALRSIDGLDKEDSFKFAFVDNFYVYFHPTLKNGYVYSVLIECFNAFLKVVKEGNVAQIDALADCLHNLPIYIVKNNTKLPKRFWIIEVCEYRNKWDKDFLCAFSKKTLFSKWFF